MNKGKFITLEGIDGAGKSTHMGWLKSLLEGWGYGVALTREPGGTPLGERLRDLLLHRDRRLNPETEALLMFAARREHLDKVIYPALDRGEWVICDRFTDASFAYQGGGSGVSIEKLRILERWVQQDFQPDLTFYIDVTVETARDRLGGVRHADRFEQEHDGFFQRVRGAYLARAAQWPGRIRVIDGNRPIPDIQKELELNLSIVCK
ncbi:MAG: dTMP kinase [Betaproteobacteria bacterium]|nr:dTMP kinase [Betaproteobacteria bacterium]